MSRKMATICISHLHGQQHEHAEQQHVEMFGIITEAYSWACDHGKKKNCIMPQDWLVYKYIYFLYIYKIRHGI